MHSILVDELICTLASKIHLRKFASLKTGLPGTCGYMPPHFYENAASRCLIVELQQQFYAKRVYRQIVRSTLPSPETSSIERIACAVYFPS